MDIWGTSWKWLGHETSWNWTCFGVALCELFCFIFHRHFIATYPYKIWCRNAWRGCILLLYCLGSGVKLLLNSECSLLISFIPSHVLKHFAFLNESRPQQFQIYLFLLFLVASIQESNEWGLVVQWKIRKSSIWIA